MQKTPDKKQQELLLSIAFFFHWDFKGKQSTSFVIDFKMSALLYLPHQPLSVIKCTAGTTFSNGDQII